MFKGLLIGLGFCVLLYIVFLIVFNKKLREMREKDNSIYKRLFKK